MKAILQRILDSVVALAMIVLSLILQGFFFGLFAVFAVPWIFETAGLGEMSDGAFYLVMAVMSLLFNGVAFYTYFVKRRANVQLGNDASFFFYIPRAIDTIVFGSQRVSRSRGRSDINPDGVSD